MKTPTLSIPDLEATDQRSTMPTFEALYEAYHAPIRRYVARTVYSAAPADPDMVEDIVQDTFIKVWRAYPGDPHRQQSYGPWIFTIARHTCIDWLRKQQRTHSHQEALTEWHACHLLAADDLLPVETRELLCSACLTLRTRDACIAAALAYGYRNREIATLLHVQPGTAKTWVMRARHALRRAMRLQEAS